MCIAWSIPAPVITVIYVVPVVVIAVVIVPVVRLPGVPVYRVVSPVPPRAPYNISRTIYESYYRPGCYNHWCCPVDCYIAAVYNRVVACITRIRCLSGYLAIEYRFYDVIFPVEILIPNKLDLHLSVCKPLHNKYCNILALGRTDGITDHYIMNISVDIINNHQVVNHVIPVKIEVVYHSILIIKILFKFFQGL